MSGRMECQAGVRHRGAKKNPAEAGLGGGTSGEASGWWSGAEALRYRCGDTLLPVWTDWQFFWVHIAPKCILMK